MGHSMSTDSLDEDAAIEKLLALVKEARSCDMGSLSLLEEHLKGIRKYVMALEADSQHTEMMTDLEYELSEILNDSDWREASGPDASKCSELFALIMTYCCPLNENIEVVLALNSHIPTSVIEKLEESNFFWEEDGTTQALARTTTNRELLRRLANSKENSTRFEVAANVNTPSDVLAELVKDAGFSDSYWFCHRGFPVSLIQYAVVTNPNTAAETLIEVIAGKHTISVNRFLAASGSSRSINPDENPDDNEWEELLESMNEPIENFPESHLKNPEQESLSLLQELEVNSAFIVSKAIEMLRAKG
jgi:hypothetical protein